ncbi:MAG: type VI secretion system contractile sheath large subunit [Alphaproteobacteria bacterium]|nr:type VI secretion system contractile sheath large subunit [Alphaproteobacteria bacterium]
MSAIAATEPTTAPTLLDEILSSARLPEEDRARSSLALGELVEGVLADTAQRGKVDVAAIDRLIADIDRKLSRQVDAILHHDRFQALESAWRGLKYVVDHADPKENVLVEYLDATKAELADDFDMAPTLRESRLSRVVFEGSYAQFGGVPYGALIGQMSFDPSTPDMALLRHVSNVAAQAHAPFVAAAGAGFFGVDSYDQLPDRTSVSTDALKKWQAFRTSPNANFVGLTLPRFLLRQPYDPIEHPVRDGSFVYAEDVSEGHESYLWGNAAAAFASCLTRSFGRYRWCANIIGPQAGGAVEDLPLHVYDSLGGQETKAPTEAAVSDVRELELAQEGFIPLVWRKGSDNAAFFSACSARKPKVFGHSPEGKAAELNFKLGSQLPYLFMVTRLAHHIRMFQRERLGSAMSRGTMEEQLNKWVRQYVSAQENPSPAVMASRPFREVHLAVEDIAGEPGWYAVNMRLRPHFKYQGSYFDLSLVGTIEPKG